MSFRGSLILSMVLLLAVPAGGCMEFADPVSEEEEVQEETEEESESAPTEPDELEEREEAEVFLRMSLEPAEVHPGETFWVYLDGVDPAEAEIDFLDERQLTHAVNGGTVALVGVGYHVEPGTYDVRARAGPTEDAIETVRKVEVVDREFEVQHLQVTEEQESQRDASLWEEDRPHMIRSRAETAPRPLWTDDFVWPVEGRITTEFGVIRYINERESGRHSGLDIAAPTGTPVLAANCGRVTLSEDLNVPGKTVVIDHGLNLFTVYYHLDERIVEEGEKVERGEVIGEVGSTGFSTGPHLHLTFSAGDIPVNPWSYLDADPLEDLREAGRHWDARRGPVPVP